MEDWDVRGERIVDGFARWAAGQRAADAAAARTRERWLRQQARESTALAGVLVDLAEQGTWVAVRTPGGVHRGHVAAVAADFCVLEGPGAPSTLVALDAVDVIQPEPGHRSSVGHRTGPLDLRFVDALDLLAGDRQPVRLMLRGGGGVQGTLDGVGTDVATVRTGGPVSGASAYVPLHAVTACTIG